MPAAPRPVDEGPGKDGKRCTHVEPSGEIVPQAAETLPATPILSVALLPDTAPPPIGGPYPSPSPFCPARGSPPLHLLHSTLLI